MKKNKFLLMSEALRDLDCAKHFCSENKIKPKLVIVIWEEGVGL